MATYQMTNEATLKGVVDACCSLLSLPIPTDAAGSSDPNIVLMRTCLNMTNLEMLNAYEWADLTKQATILVKNNSGTTPPPTGEAYEEAYDLPEDFFRFIDQTQWNGAMRFPAVGPVSPQGWMTYMVFPVSANFTLTWQIRQNKIWFLNPPPDPGQEFRFMYLSRALVQDADNPDLYKNIATKNGDKFQIDGLLVTLMTRVKWLEAKGFDSSAAVRDMMLAFDSRIGAEKGANILNLAGNRGGYPYVGIGNLPDASLYGMRQW
jgi:hypothetical protein